MPCKLASWMEVGIEARDDAWFRGVLEEVPRATYQLCADAEVQSESGFPFLAARPAEGEPGSLPFDKLLGEAIERGEGLVISDGEAPGPGAFSLSFGELWSYREYAGFSGTEEFLQEPTRRPDNQVLIGAPAEGLFPAYARKAIRGFLRELGLDEPQVLVVNDPESTFSCSLVFNVFGDDFESEEEFDEVMNGLVWHLPRGIGLVGVNSDTFDEESYQPV